MIQLTRRLTEAVKLTRISMKIDLSSIGRAAYRQSR